ncbi:SulP family inorganic anion transporter [Marinobacterium sedimentorum]|uniref:SulP family inorganic anion transporter n=1 Tax=Marinobacterium sedimentorum TaxID=2927804 RepID=UPI0020C659B4|nr:SulP family inorganic anion transporter [Marinobacterium sedimentorum]MCP8686204.1 SulP family inorganic anion transporter [Marinobacterium sedimentorum]
MKRRLPLRLPFFSWGGSLNKNTLADDLIAGITGAVIALPQAVAYAFIAGLPPEYGLYSAIIISVIAALFGSSWHMVSGPAAAISIVVLSVVSGIGELDPAQYLSAVLTLTLLVGLMQFGMGLLRLGTLVNFISHTVVIGFTAGAAILIGTSQLKHVLGVAVPGGLSFIDGVSALIDQTGAVNTFSLAIGAITLLSALLVRRLNRRWPHLLIGMATGSLVCALLDGQAHDVALVGALPGTLPPLSMPDLSAHTIQSLASGAFALALLGLIEAVSIARAIALRSHQQINGNQEFIGQGLANTLGSFFSCFVGSGSFTRSGANYDAGARTPLAAVFAASIQVCVLLLAPGLTAYLPLPAMAGAVLLIAWNLIDFHHIRQIIKSSRNEAIVLLVTFMSTLFIELEFAIYIGVFLSLGIYLRRTSRPTVMEVAPIQDHPRRQIKNIQRYALQQCPQLKIIRIDGSLFFGAIDHIQQRIRALTHEGSGTKRVLIIGKGINFIDIAGAEMLIQEARRLQQRGGKLMFSSIKGTLMDELRANGYLEKIGEELFFDSPEAALADSVVALDQDVCDNCSARIFRECATPANGEMIAVSRI